MANYYANFRTNYFKVKDAEKFKQWADQIGVEVYLSHEKQMWAIFPGKHDDTGSIPTNRWVPDNINDEELITQGWTEEEISEGYQEIDFLKELSGHLEEDQVAVVMEAGSEKLRYLNGYAGAVNAAGEVVEINLDQIYELAQKTFGIKPTLAQY